MSVPAADDGGNDDRLDCLVIGAGPAGLTAATYFARFHRRFVVVDGGHSRARWIPSSHNCPGFPFGVAGPALLEKLREQATNYGARIIQDRIVTLQRDGENGFIATAASGAHWHASHVLLATGIVDRMPPIADIEDAIAAGVVRLCAVCDGYEANDERIAVYGPVEEAISHAVFLRTFSRSVTAIPSDASTPDARSLALAQHARVEVLPMPSRLRHDTRRCVVEFDGAGTPAGTCEFDTREFDTIYPVLGGAAQAGLATALGARVDDSGELIVDHQQQTSVDGLYASGDVVSALNQISVAVGHAAIAATAIHNRLPHNFREDS